MEKENKSSKEISAIKKRVSIMIFMVFFGAIAQLSPDLAKIGIFGTMIYGFFVLMLT